MAEALLMWLLRVLEGRVAVVGGVQGQWELSIFIPRSETNRSELMNNEADDWWRDDDGGR